MKWVSKCALIFLAALILMTIAQILNPEPAIIQDVDAILLSPSSAHWFGTDSLGRSLFWRVFAGAKISLCVGIICPIVILLFGSFIGFVAGWWGGWVDRTLVRLFDLLTALPSFLLVSVFAVICMAIIPDDWGMIKILLVLCIGISGTHWMSLARIARAQVKRLRHRPFVEAAESLGGSSSHIVWVHILPNVKRTIIVAALLQIPTSIMYESFMSFIGLGIQAPQTSWGILIKEGWQSLATFPHLILIPSIFLFLTIWSFHILLDEYSKDLRT